MSHSRRAETRDELSADFGRTESSDLAGLKAEAPTLEARRDELPPLISKLIEDNEPTSRGRDIVVEIIAQTQTRVPAGA